MRLVTRPDLDGVVCGSIITAVEPIDSYLFVEPKFMQDGQVEVRPGDIIANLPYHPNCSLWFDHHITNAPAWAAHAGLSEAEARDPANAIVIGKGGFRLAPSAARVVYEYYRALGARADAPRRVRDGLELLESERFRYLLDETDRVDAGKLEPKDVLQPEGYVLISMTIDGKRAEDEPYWRELVSWLRDLSLPEVMAKPEVKRRCREILDAQEKLKAILLERSALRQNVIFVDLRGIVEVPDGNRFLLYTLFPTANISLKVADDPQRPGYTAISVGYNIFNPTSKVNVGELLEKHGGGGHRVVGSCRVPAAAADGTIREIMAAILEPSPKR